MHAAFDIAAAVGYTLSRRRCKLWQYLREKLQRQEEIRENLRT